MEDTIDTVSALGILSMDPSGVYQKLDARTLGQYHAALRQLQDGTGRKIDEIARLILDRARAAAKQEGADSRRAHVGYYLVGAGAAELMVEHSTRRAARYRGLGTGAYVPLSLLSISALALAGEVALYGAGVTGLWTALGTLCLIPIATIYTARAVLHITWRERKPLPLPRLAELPPELASSPVLIALPAILATPKCAELIVGKLRSLADAHDRPEYRFVLLSDFADAETEVTSADNDILAILDRGVRELNRDSFIGDRFFALHRKRSYSGTQNAWIGWERKRGKLLELMRLLNRDRRESTFGWYFGNFDPVVSSGVRYLLSVDEATSLMPGTASALIRTAMHPLNRPVLNPVTNRVVDGYAVLQPALSFGFAAPNSVQDGLRETKTLGHTGSALFRVLDCAAHASAAALYDVATFQAALDGRLPNDMVLHHDLIEGYIARTGEVPDAIAFQPWPRTYLAQRKRGHRWLRGVLQLVPLLRSRFDSEVDIQKPTPLTLDQRYVIAELILREAARPASFILLLLIWSLSESHALLLSIFVCPELFIAAVTGLSTVLGAPVRYFRKRRTSSFTTISRIVSALMAIVTLVCDAAVFVDAAFRTSWRMLISRRHLLEWQPHASQAPGSRRAIEYWRTLWVSPVAGVLALAAIAGLNPATITVAAPFCVMWMLAPGLLAVGDDCLFGGRTSASLASRHGVSPRPE